MRENMENMRKQMEEKVSESLEGNTNGNGEVNRG